MMGRTNRCVLSFHLQLHRVKDDENANKGGHSEQERPDNDQHQHFSPRLHLHSALAAILCQVELAHDQLWTFALQHSFRAVFQGFPRRDSLGTVPPPAACRDCSIQEPPAGHSGAKPSGRLSWRRYARQCDLTPASVRFAAPSRWRDARKHQSL